MSDVRRRLAHVFRQTLADELRKSTGIELSHLQAALHKRKKRFPLNDDEAKALLTWELTRV